MKNPILQMKDIVKEFPGVKALDGVNLELYEGKVMALMDVSQRRDLLLTLKSFTVMQMHYLKS